MQVVDEVFVPGWVVKDKIQLFNISDRMDIKDIDVFVASEEHLKYAPIICQAIETAAYARGTGIAKRKPEYIENKMKDGKAIIAPYPGRAVCGLQLYRNVGT